MWMQRKMSRLNYDSLISATDSEIGKPPVRSTFATSVTEDAYSGHFKKKRSLASLCEWKNDQTSFASPIVEGGNLICQENSYDSQFFVPPKSRQLENSNGASAQQLAALASSFIQQSETGYTSEEHSGASIYGSSEDANSFLTPSESHYSQPPHDQQQQNAASLEGIFSTSQVLLCGVKKHANSQQSQHIKKPLNAFMLFMKEMRAKVVAECTLKESAAINQILGRKWHSLTREEQAKYYEMARKEKELHQQMYPNWSARDNYATHSKRKKKSRSGIISASKQPGRTAAEYQEPKNVHSSALTNYHDMLGQFAAVTTYSHFSHHHHQQQHDIDAVPEQSAPLPHDSSSSSFSSWDHLRSMEQDRRFSALNYTPSGVMHPGWYNSGGIIVSNESTFDNLAMTTPVTMAQSRFSTLAQSPGQQNQLLEAVSALENNRGANEELYSAAAAAAIALHQSSCSNFSQQLLTNYQQRFNTVCSPTASEQKPVQDPTVDTDHEQREFQSLN